MVKWVNRNILVYSSITGLGYCKSMAGAMRLLMGSFLTSTSVKLLSMIFLESSKIVISIGNACLTMFLIMKFGDTEYFIMPSVCVGVLVYLVSFYIIGIVTITVDTVLLCFLYEDEELRSDR